jgi:hypothetical protein
MKRLLTILLLISATAFAQDAKNKKDFTTRFIYWNENNQKFDTVYGKEAENWGNTSKNVWPFPALLTINTTAHWSGDTSCRDERFPYSEKEIKDFEKEFSDYNYTMTPDGVIIYQGAKIAPGEDSLWTESPVIKDAAIAPVTVGQEFTTTGGRLKAIKFWKNETAGNYVITLWHPTGASLFSQSYRSTTIGWQRLTYDWPLEAGTYVVGVYYEKGKYVYTNGLNPRTRGKLTGTKGLFAGGNNKPGGSYTASFFVDVVVGQPVVGPVISTLTPDSVNISYPWIPVTLNATATNAVSYGWRVEDSTGTWTIDSSNRLKPVITAKSAGNLFLVFTATAANGTQWSSISILYAEPDPNKIIGYLMEGGRVFYRKAIVVF